MAETIKEVKIRNKYDMYDVQFQLNEFFSSLMENDLKAVKSETKEYCRLAISFVMGAFILFSYFHPTPFPLDKVIIFVCTIFYYIFAGLLELYKKYKLKNIFAEFYVSKASLPSHLTKISKFFVKDLGLFVLSSNIELFTNKYTLQIQIHGHSVETTVSYNEYIFNDGTLAEDKLKKLFENLLNSMK
jgi:hypothetical protein